MVSDRIIESSKVGKKGRVLITACFSIINYSYKKWGKILKVIFAIFYIIF